MPTRLAHRQIHAVMSALSEAKIVNLDASLQGLLKPVADSLSHAGAGDEVSLHVLCCNEYFLVTGLTGGSIQEVENIADAIRKAIAPGR